MSKVIGKVPSSGSNIEVSASLGGIELFTDSDSLEPFVLTLGAVDARTLIALLERAVDEHERMRQREAGHR